MCSKLTMPPPLNKRLMAIADWLKINNKIVVLE